MGPRRRRVVWARRASEALDHAIAYVAHDSPDTARSLLSRVLDKAASLDEFSERGSPVGELEDDAYRELLVDPYRLIYRVDETSVIIVALLHQRQDIIRWRRRG